MLVPRLLWLVPLVGICALHESASAEEERGDDLFTERIVAVKNTAGDVLSTIFETTPAISEGTATTDYPSDLHVTVDDETNDGYQGFENSDNETIHEYQELGNSDYQSFENSSNDYEVPDKSDSNISVKELLEGNYTDDGLKGINIIRNWIKGSQQSKEIDITNVPINGNIENAEILETTTHEIGTEINEKDIIEAVHDIESDIEKEINELKDDIKEKIEEIRKEEDDNMEIGSNSNDADKGIQREVDTTTETNTQFNTEIKLDGPDSLVKKESSTDNPITQNGSKSINQDEEIKNSVETTDDQSNNTENQESENGTQISTDEINLSQELTSTTGDDEAEQTTEIVENVTAHSVSSDNKNPQIKDVAENTNKETATEEINTHSSKSDISKNTDEESVNDKSDIQEEQTTDVFKDIRDEQLAEDELNSSPDESDIETTEIPKIFTNTDDQIMTEPTELQAELSSSDYSTSQIMSISEETKNTNEESLQNQLALTVVQTTEVSENIEGKTDKAKLQNNSGIPKISEEIITELQEELGSSVADNEDDFTSQTMGVSEETKNADEVSLQTELHSTVGDSDEIENFQTTEISKSTEDETEKTKPHDDFDIQTTDNPKVSANPSEEIITEQTELQKGLSSSSEDYSTNIQTMGTSEETKNTNQESIRNQLAFTIGDSTEITEKAKLHDDSDIQTTDIPKVSANTSEEIITDETELQEELSSSVAENEDYSTSKTMSLSEESKNTDELHFTVEDNDLEFSKISKSTEEETETAKLEDDSNIQTTESAKDINETTEQVDLQKELNSSVWDSEDYSVNKNTTEDNHLEEKLNSSADDNEVNSETTDNIENTESTEEINLEEMTNSSSKDNEDNSVIQTTDFPVFSKEVDDINLQQESKSLGDDGGTDSDKQTTDVPAFSKEVENINLQGESKSSGGDGGTDFDKQITHLSEDSKNAADESAIEEEETNSSPSDNEADSIIHTIDDNEEMITETTHLQEENSSTVNDSEADAEFESNENNNTPTGTESKGEEESSEKLESEQDLDNEEETKHLPVEEMLSTIEDDDQADTVLTTEENVSLIEETDHDGDKKLFTTTQADSTEKPEDYIISMQETDSTETTEENVSLIEEKDHDIDEELFSTKQSDSTETTEDYIRSVQETDATEEKVLDFDSTLGTTEHGEVPKVLNEEATGDVIDASNTELSDDEETTPSNEQNDKTTTIQYTIPEKDIEALEREGWEVVDYSELREETSSQKTTVSMNTIPKNTTVTTEISSTDAVIINEAVQTNSKSEELLTPTTEIFDNSKDELTEGEGNDEYAVSGLLETTDSPTTIGEDIDQTKTETKVFDVSDSELTDVSQSDNALRSNTDFDTDETTDLPTTRGEDTDATKEDDSVVTNVFNVSDSDHTDVPQSDNTLLSNIELTTAETSDLPTTIGEDIVVTKEDDSEVTTVFEHTDVSQSDNALLSNLELDTAETTDLPMTIGENTDATKEDDSEVTNVFDVSDSESSDEPQFDNALLSNTEHHTAETTDLPTIIGEYTDVTKKVDSEVTTVFEHTDVSQSNNALLTNTELETTDLPTTIGEDIDPTKADDSEITKVFEHTDVSQSNTLDPAKTTDLPTTLGSDFETSTKRVSEDALPTNTELDTAETTTFGLDFDTTTKTVSEEDGSVFEDTNTIPIQVSFEKRDENETTEGVERTTVETSETKYNFESSTLSSISSIKNVNLETHSTQQGSEEDETTATIIGRETQTTPIASLNTDFELEEMTTSNTVHIFGEFEENETTSITLGHETQTHQETPFVSLKTDLELEEMTTPNTVHIFEDLTNGPQTMKGESFLAESISIKDTSTETHIQATSSKMASSEAIETLITDKAINIKGLNEEDKEIIEELEKEILLDKLEEDILEEEIEKILSTTHSFAINQGTKVVTESMQNIDYEEELEEVEHAIEAAANEQIEDYLEELIKTEEQLPTTISVDELTNSDLIAEQNEINTLIEEHVSTQISELDSSETTTEVITTPTTEGYGVISFFKNIYGIMSGSSTTEEANVNHEIPITTREYISTSITSEESKATTIAEFITEHTSEEIIATTLAELDDLVQSSNSEIPTTIIEEEDLVPSFNSEVPTTIPEVEDFIHSSNTEIPTTVAEFITRHYKEFEEDSSERYDEMDKQVFDVLHNIKNMITTEAYEGDDDVDVGKTITVIKDSFTETIKISEEDGMNYSEETDEDYTATETSTDGSKVIIDENETSSKSVDDKRELDNTRVAVEGVTTEKGGEIEDGDRTLIKPEHTNATESDDDEDETEYDEYEDEEDDKTLPDLKSPENFDEDSFDLPDSPNGDDNIITKLIDTFNIMSTNSLEDDTDSTQAASDDELTSHDISVLREDLEDLGNDRKHVNDDVKEIDGILKNKKIHNPNNGRLHRIVGSIYNDYGDVCLNLNLSARININNTIVTVPPNAVVRGNCSNSEIHVKISWRSILDGTANNTIYFIMRVEGTHYYISYVHLNLIDQAKKGMQEHEMLDLQALSTDGQAVNKSESISFKNNITLELIDANMKVQEYFGSLGGSVTLAYGNAFILQITSGCICVLVVLVVLGYYMYRKARSKERILKVSDDK